MKRGGEDTFLQRRSDGGISSNHRILGDSSLIRPNCIPRIPNRTRRILNRLSRSPNLSVKSRPPTHKMRIINWRHDAHDASAPRIHMTEIITQSLQIVHRQLVLVHKDRVVRGAGGALQTWVGKEVVVIELGMTNVVVDDGAGHAVAGAISFTTVSGEEADMVPFGDHNESHLGTVALFEGLAGGADGFDFGFDDMRELTFGDPIAEEQDTFGLGFGLLVKSLEVRWESDGPWEAGP